MDFSISEWSKDIISRHEADDSVRMVLTAAPAGGELAWSYAFNGPGGDGAHGRRLSGIEHRGNLRDLRPGRPADISPARPCPTGVWS